MLANLIISNPFGLPERRYLAGAEVEIALPISLLAPGQSLNVTGVTYAEGLQIAFLGMAAELPNLQRLADLTVKAFAELTAAATSARTIKHERDREYLDRVEHSPHGHQQGRGR
jgi:hypothetical protein